MGLARYERDDEALANIMKSTRAGARDVQRATGTEKARTTDVAYEAKDAAAVATESARAASLMYVFADHVPTVHDGDGRPSGAMWVVKSGTGEITEYWEWSGSVWESRPLSQEAIPLIVAGMISVGALDSMTIRGAQIFGGYIEAPTIASSDKLGSGTNVLNDPTFQGNVNSSWTVSGHTGDTAARPQTDTVRWDQTWQQAEWSYETGTVQHGVRNWGSIDAVATLTPNNSRRSTGSLLFSNISWSPTAGRTFNNPYAFVDKAWLQYEPAQNGGDADPTFGKLHGAPATGNGTARTTYLTNTASAAVTSGERWNVKLGFTPVSIASLPYVSGMWVEILNASDSSVLWSVQLNAAEIMAGQVNAWWDAGFTGNVRYRIKVTYTAGGNADFARRPSSGSFARRFTKGNTVDEWISGSTGALYYGQKPTRVPAGLSMSVPQDWSSRLFAITATSALFAKVTPQKGWRLTTDGGFEMFDSLGAQTGRLDGESNFLNGRFGSKDGGARAVMQGQSVYVTNNAGATVGVLSSDGQKSRLFANEVVADGYNVYGEEGLDLSRISVRGGYVIVAGSWVQKRADGFVRGVLIARRQNSSGVGVPIAGDENGAAILTMPSGWRGTWEGACATSQGGNSDINFGQITSGGAVRVWNPATGNAQAAWQFEFKAA